MQEDLRTRSRTASVLPWVEGALWVTAFVCVCWCAVMYTRARQFVHAQPVRPTAAAATGRAVQAPPAPGELIGRMEIPALQLSVAVVEDDSRESLQHGVGHIPLTAMPGGLGTVGLAGHRDTFLRPLRRITPGMQVRLSGPGGVYRYLVDTTQIVLPEAVEVLETADQPALVIVTCYPFDYVGAAPKRFIVHAHLLSVLPEK
ncbi:MAG TPA: class D sortase [Acidobacteriaceae bacterium]